MKTTLIVAVAAAACVSAQSTSTPSTMTMSMPMSMPMPSSSTSLSTSVSFTTIYEYDTCLETLSSAATVTNGVTETYCPQCSHGSSGATAATSTGPHTTVYTTAYQVFCPTGLSSAVYTITETCTDAVPHFSSGASYMPPGFTQTVSVCNVCGPTPITATLTVPCDLCAGLTPTQPASTDAGPVMPSMSTGPAAAATATATVCPGPACICPGPSCVCPGPGCPSGSESVVSVGRPSSTGASPAQFTGGADGLARNAHAAFVLSGVAVGVVGMFAGLL